MTVDVVSLRDVMLKLDIAHGELVHSILMLRYIRPEMFEQTERRKAQKYKKMCISFFRQSRTLLPQMADYACVLLTRLCENEMARTGKHTRYDEAERMIWRLALRRIRVADNRPMTAWLNNMYATCLPTDSLLETMRNIAPVIEQTAGCVNRREYYKALGNLEVIFRVLHKVRRWHPEWYEDTTPNGGSGLGMMLDLARGFYCKMRAKEDLKASFVEEMDARAVVMNAQYDRMFGDWDETSFTDMVKGKGLQERDYSQVETWPSFATLIKEAVMKTDTLRDYQQVMLNRLEEAWNGHRSVMVQMPTGTGKTHLMAAVIRGLTTSSRGGEGIGQACALIVVHRTELMEQISRTLDAFGIDHGLIVGDKHVDDTKSIQVASIQALSRREIPLPPRHPDGTLASVRNHPEGKGRFEPTLVIVDEAHHAQVKTYGMLWKWWPQARFLGLTATPCRLNGKPFTDLFDTLLESWSIREFIQKGWLSDLDYLSARSDSRAVQQIVRLDKRGADGDFQTKQMAMVLDVPESIEHLYRSYKHYADGKKGIVYAINRSHAKHIAECYEEHGVRCAVIDSKTSAKARQKTLEDYRQQTLDVLVNVDIFSEGFDCPEVEFIQLARPTMSLSQYLQQVGLGMRLTECKREVTILDQVGSYLLFGLPTSDRNWLGMFLGKASGKGVLRVQSQKEGWSKVSEEMEN
jgi:superfamily II DNA or RNA helicase